MWYGCHYYYQDLYWQVESLKLQSTILLGPSMVGAKVAGVRMSAKVRFEALVLCKLYNIALSTVTAVFRNMLLK